LAPSVKIVTVRMEDDVNACFCGTLEMVRTITIAYDTKNP
jgi:hypothetical protein